MQIYFGSAHIFLGTVAADVMGNFISPAYTVPANATVGVNRVDGSGTMVPEASDKAPFRVQ